MSRFRNLLATFSEVETRSPDQTFEMSAVCATVPLINIPLLQACKEKDWNRVSKLIGKYANDLAYLSRTRSTYQNKTVLHYLCEQPCEKEKLVTKLIEQILAKIDGKCSQTELTTFLNLEAGEEKQTALNFALSNQHTKVATILVSKGAAYTQPAIIQFCKEQNGWTDVFMEIDSGLNFEQWAVLNAADNCKNILHYLCAFPEGDDKFVNKTLDKLFDRMKDIPYTKKQLQEFLNAQTIDKEYSALHYAIENKHWYAVERLLQYGADVNLRTINGNTDALGLIYEHLHVILIKLFNKSYDVMDSEYDPGNQLLQKAICNFTPIAGVPDDSKHINENAKYRQTTMLAETLRQKQTNRAPILMHPLVQIFLYHKGKKMQGFITCSIIYHFLWSLLATVYFSCSFHETYKSATQNQTNAVSAFLIQYFGGPYIYYSTDSGTHFTYVFWVVFVFWMVMSAKELTEYLLSPSWRFYINQWENIGQILILGLLLISTVLARKVLLLESDGVTTADVLRQGLFLVNTIGIGVAILLIQAQSTKSKTLGVYNELLIKVLLKFVKFFLAFLPMLLAFVLLFYRLVPTEKQKHFYSEWRVGINKVLAMMTGELNHDDLIPDENELYLKWLGASIGFFLFVVSVTIVLQNLLLGLTIDDMAKLKRKALVHHLAARLEVMHLLEQVLTHDLLLCCLGRVKWYTNFLNSLLLQNIDENRNDATTESLSSKPETSPVDLENPNVQTNEQRDNSASKFIEISLKDLPTELRKVLNIQEKCSVCRLRTIQT